MRQKAFQTLKYTFIDEVINCLSLPYKLPRSYKGIRCTFQLIKNGCSEQSLS